MTRGPVGIVGGGLAGLSLAFWHARAGNQVELFEASARFGGQLRSERSGGFVVEHGAEGFVAKSEAVPRLARALGIAEDLIDQRVHRSFGYDGQHLLELSPGEAARLLGFQVPVEELGKGIRSFRLGMAQLADALVEQLQGLTTLVRMRAGVTVTSVEPSSGGVRLGWQGGPDGPGLKDFEDVVLATSSAEAGRLLHCMLGEPALQLARARTLSSVTVSLAFDSSAIHYPREATGFIVQPEAQSSGFRACSFSSSKLPNRAPAGKDLLRVFFRPEGGQLRDLSDDQYRALAEGCLRRVLGELGSPLATWVSRWENALPVFDPAHVACVRAVEEGLSRADMGARVALCGAAFHGSGIDAALRSAERTAGALSPLRSIT